VVVARGREVLAILEGGELDEEGRPRLSHRPSSRETVQPPGAERARGDAESQLGLFRDAGDAPSAEHTSLRAALAELRALDLERTTPLEALGHLARFVARLKGERS
jgi:hypothetical protein